MVPAPSRTVRRPLTVLALATAVVAAGVAAAPAALADGNLAFNPNTVTAGSDGNVTLTGTAAGYPLGLLGGSGKLTVSHVLNPGTASEKTETSPAATTADTSNGFSATVNTTALDPGSFDGKIVISGLLSSSTDSCSACVTIQVPPVIGSLAGGPFAQGGSYPVTLTGTGFRPGSAVALDGQPAFTRSDDGSDQTKITGTLVIPQTADPATPHTLSVTQIDGETTSTPITVAPGPKIVTVSPSAIHRGSSSPSFTVTGNNFQPNSTLAVDGASGDAAITVSNVTVSSDGKKITAGIAVGPVAIVGTHTVTVTNPTNGGLASRADLFSVAGDPPTAPQNVSATVTTNSITVGFVPPANDGGSKIDTYTATAFKGADQIQGTAPGSPIVIPGLLSGTTYAITVAAHNATGLGPSSAPITVKTAGSPPQMILNPSATKVLTGRPVTLTGSVPPGPFAANALVIVTSRTRDGATGLAEVATTDGTGHFRAVVKPVYDTCYTVSASSYSRQVCIKAVARILKVKTARSRGVLRVSTSLAPGVQLTKKMRYIAELDLVDARGHRLKRLATARPTQRHAAVGFQPYGVNDVRFAVAAPPVGSRIAIVIASDPMNTVTATKPIRI